MRRFTVLEADMEAISEMAVVSAPTSGTVHYAKGINPGSDVRAGATIAIIDSHGTSGGDRRNVRLLRRAALSRFRGRGQALRLRRRVHARGRARVRGQRGLRGCACMLPMQAQALWSGPVLF